MRLSSRHLPSLAAALILGLLSLPSPAGANSKKAEPAGDLPVFFEIDPIQIPVLRADGRILYNVVVLVSLEVASKESAEELRRIAPRLRNAMLHAVHGKRLGRTEDPGQLDLARLKGRLLPAARRAAEDVEIKSVAIRGLQRAMR